MKNLFLASLVFFALAAAAREPKTQEPNPEKEAFLSARYEGFKKSCAQKDAKACKRVVRFYKKGAAQRSEKDARAATEILNKMCGEKEFAACAALGEIYIKDKNFAAAREILSPACKDGYPDACAIYGLSFEAKAAEDRDERRAVSLYESACESGSAIGCEHLGISYKDGSDVERGLSYLRKACKIDARSCFSLGVSSAPYGFSDAIKALKKNCYETQMLTGCLMLADIYDTERLDTGEAEMKRLYARLCELMPYEKKYCKKAR